MDNEKSRNLIEIDLSLPLCILWECKPHLVIWNLFADLLWLALNCSIRSRNRLLSSNYFGYILQTYIERIEIMRTRRKREGEGIIGIGNKIHTSTLEDQRSSHTYTTELDSRINPTAFVFYMIE